MPRIRSIKPEFFDSPGTSAASPWARLLYIAMWCWADDWGIGDANPRRLLGFAFPEDESSEVEPRNFRHLATEVQNAYGVIWYTTAGREFYAIPSWEKHQRTEKRAKQRFPGPDQAERTLYGSTSEVPSLDLGSSVVGTGEQGKGEREELLSNAPRRTPSTTPGTAESDADFDEFWSIYPRREAKKNAVKAWAKARKDTPAPRIILGAKRYAEDPNREQTFTKLPATWLNSGCWDDEPLPPRNVASLDARRPQAATPEIAEDMRRNPHKYR